MLLVYMLGAILQDNWRMVAIISTVVPVLSVLAVWLLVPESPVWLTSRRRFDEAELNMKTVRNLSADDKLPEELQEELEFMISNKESSQKDGWMDTLRFLKKPEAYKPLIIMNLFIFFQQFSGILVVMMYTVNIVKEIGVQFDGYLATVMIGATRFAMSLLISFASKKYGRRPMCNFSGVGMTFSLTALATYMNLVHDGVVARGQASWVPISLLVVFILTATVGFYNLPFAMLGEVFPTRIRGSAVGFTTCLAAMFCFVSVKIFPNLKDAFEYRNVFTFYAVVCVIGTITMYKYLPETHGKTLKEIEQAFKGRSRKRSQIRVVGESDIE